MRRPCSAFEWDQAGSVGVIMNMSVWESVEALAAFVYSRQHRQVLRRRREWFERMERRTWRCGGSRAARSPPPANAEDRIRHLRAHGPTPRAFTLRVHFPPPGKGETAPRPGRADWMCPA